MSITVTLTVFCETHPKYQGIRRPLSIEACWACEDVYALRHPENFSFEVEKVEVYSGS